MSAQNLRQRRQLHLVAQYPSVRAYQQTQRAHYEDMLEALRYEQARAERIDAQLQTDALLDRVRAAGQIGCAVEDPQTLTLGEVARIIGCGFLAMSLLLAFGYAAAPLLVRFLDAVRAVLP